MVWSGRRSKPQKDEVREERITMQIVVDAYNEDEGAMGWYYYLQERVVVPFLARCVEERAVSPLSVGDEVEASDKPNAFGGRSLPYFPPRLREEFVREVREHANLRAEEDFPGRSGSRLDALERGVNWLRVSEHPAQTVP